MKKKMVAIHQPDFMPWIGFFLKIWRADIFVVLDHVTNQPRARSWFRRVRFVANGAPIWISIPVQRRPDSPVIPINQMKIVYNKDTIKLFNKYKRTIWQHYKRCPFFEEYYVLFTEYFDAISEETHLSSHNMKFILKVFKMLEITPQIYYSSQLECNASKTELLIEIIKKVGGNKYIAGEGAKAYQDDDLLRKNNIEVYYNNFVPKRYPQCNTKEFIPGLSVLDALMNIGADGVKRILDEYGKI